MSIFQLEFDIWILKVKKTLISLCKRINDCPDHTNVV